MLVVLVFAEFGASGGLPVSFLTGGAGSLISYRYPAAEFKILLGVDLTEFANFFLGVNEIPFLFFFLLF